MRRLSFFILLLWGGRLQAENLEWLGDFGRAQEKAKAEHKFVMLDFTGSDWCRWCIYLKREVFDKPEFAAFAQEKLVLVEVDFPEQKMMAHLQKQANAQLKKRFHVTGYPTIVILDPDGEQLGRFGYVHGGPPRFIDEVQSLIKRVKQPAPPAAAATEPVEPPRKPFVFSLTPPAAPLHYGPLALKGISGPKERRMVLINNASLMKGETGKVRAEDHDVVVFCKDIREDSVLVTCDGKELELKLPQK
jgi:thioredoxin-related protein